MKKILTTLVLLIFLCGCNNKETNVVGKFIFKIEDPINLRVNKEIQELSLEEKVGQMIFISNESNTYTNNLRNQLEEVKPGGFILFKENFTSYEKSLDLIKNIKESSKIPMFIGIDQEGGTVQRLYKLSDCSASKIPNMYDVGKTEDENLAADVARVLAEELRVFGINLDFAPSLDVFSNPLNTVIGKRAFGSNSTIVSKMGLAFGKSLEKNGIIPVYKHFPGHGDTSADSHYSLPVINKSFGELENLELIPFKEAIKSGVDVIMVGHLALPKVTGDNVPASLSKTIITDILKNKLGFNGIVTTDAVNMGALTKNYTESEIYEMSINAGVDVILMPNNPIKAKDIIVNLVENGKISEKRIDESVSKILEVKYRKIEENYDNYLDKSYLSSAEHKNILNKFN